MKIALVIRHVAYEDLGLFERTLENAGYQVKYLEAGMDELTWIEPLVPELLIVLGGPISANGEADYPFIEDELNILETRLQYDFPTLGICLGAQLMARALGARVYPGQREIGWKPLQLNQYGENSALRHLNAGNTSMFHWHGDTFDLPEGAVRLASTDVTKNQAFSWKKKGLALQFHPEVSPHGLERWFIGCCNDIERAEGVSLEQLRNETRQYGYEMDVHANAFLQEWLLSIK